MELWNELVRVGFAFNTLNKIEYIMRHTQNIVVGEKISGDGMFNLFLNGDREKSGFVTR